ncbi:MAG: S8 family serine peptidase [Candidatus Odinarchaeota archaeon]
MMVYSSAGYANFIIKDVIPIFRQTCIKRRLFLIRRIISSFFDKKWTVLVFLTVLPLLVVTSLTEATENRAYIAFHDGPAERYIVFLPEGSDYPWPDQILHRYRLIPALLVCSTLDDLLNWLKSNPGAIIQPDNNYQLSLASESVEMLPPQEIHAKDVVKAQVLHDEGINGSGVRIGIIDTGIYEDHMELAGKIVAEESFVLEKFGYSQDITDPSPNQPHGTEVAGVAAGKTIGIAPGAELVSAKIFHEGVGGNAGECSEETTSALLAAIEYAIEEGCDIINLSFAQYHNLVDDERAAIVDYFTRNYGVIFCVAAGNEGRLPYCSGTIGNPGSAFQAITVAAYCVGAEQMASFSGTGPRPDYTMKPDITAPGVCVVAPSDNSDSYSGFSGTSAASPVVAGAAALLIQYMEQNNLAYSPGTIKAALLNGAVEITAGNATVPPDYQGAGLLNVENAWNNLVSANVIGTEKDLLASFPERLPFRPFTTLFTGESVSFNATIISSRKTTATVTLEGLPPEFISFPEVIELADSVRLPIEFSIPKDAGLGHYSGKLIVVDECKTITAFQLEFDVKEPRNRVLFDEKHTILTYRPYTGTGSWGDNNFLSGMFREYAEALIERNISITPFREGLLTTGLLENYDALVLANPCSWVVDKYTDWLDPEQLSCIYASYDSSEYDAIENFVKEQGGGLLVFTLGSETVNVEALNGLLTRFGISLSSDESFEYALVQNYNNNLPFLEGIYGYTHYGSTVSVETASGAFEAAYLNNQVVAAGNYYPSSEGKILVFATDYPFINMGMEELFHSNSSNNILAMQVTEWACDNSAIQPQKEAKNAVIDLFSPVFLFFEVLVATILIEMLGKSYRGIKQYYLLR